MSNARGIADSDLSRLTVDSTTLVVDDTNNRVGIGTSSPSAKLHITDSTGSAVTLLKMQTGWNNPSGNKSMVWQDGTGDLGRISVSYNAPQAKMTFGSLYNSGYQSSDLMTLTATGRLGIGTTGPATTLDARGDACLGTNLYLGADTVFQEQRLSVIGTTSGSTGLAFSQWTGSAYAERLRIDSAGRVTMPYQPSAALGRLSTWSSNTTVLWDQVHHNIGNHYNSATGLFTCPVAGIYMISIMAMTDATVATLDIEAQKNGSVYQGLVPYQSAGPSYNQVSGVTFVSCSAGDTLAFKLNGGNIYGASNSGRHSACAFRLMG